MTAVPSTMADHWSLHAGWRPGRRFLTTYLTFTGQPKVADLAAHYQRGLDLPTLDPVPAEWLHLTVQSIGFTDEIPTGTTDKIGVAARKACASVAPFMVTLRSAVLADQGVLLPAAPCGPLVELQETIRDAAVGVLGADNVTDVDARFIPHVTVAYCNAAGDAAPVHEHLAAIEARSATIAVRAVHLLEISRDTHVYQWRTIEEIPFGG